MDGNKEINWIGNFIWIGNWKLHLNRKGTTLFTKNIYKSFSSRFEWNAGGHPTITDSTNQPSLNQNIPLEKLKELRLDNLKNHPFSHLNIKLVRNKFDSLQEIVMGKTDILIVAETKIHGSFPTAQFSAEGYHKLSHLDVSEKRDSISVYINSSIPSRQLYCRNLNLSIQAVIFEINLREDKWLVISVYSQLVKTVNVF